MNISIKANRYTEFDAEPDKPHFLVIAVGRISGSPLENEFQRMIDQLPESARTYHNMLQSPVFQDIADGQLPEQVMRLVS